MTTITSIYDKYSEWFLVDTDTRNIRKNSIFFALKGDHFNGNTFAQDALDKGAAYAVIDEEAYATSNQFILVDNVLETLQALANYHRKQLQIPFIGLTGSNGKTTTKELITAVLSQKFQVRATKGNLNNHIGVPLTLLSVLPSDEIAVIEMGANHQKEIAFLSKICEPDFGYITNFGKAHLEGFGGVEGVIKGKSELYTYLKQNKKTAYVNPNDPIQVEKTKDISSIDLNLTEIQLADTQPTLRISYKNQIFDTQLIGAYNFYNIAAAMTIGAHFDVSDLQIRHAIASYISENNRSQVLRKGSFEITLDAYNANPSSMKVALETFAEKQASIKTVILGDMFELGDDSYEEHQAIASLVQRLPIDHAFFIGENFFEVNSYFLHFETYDDFLHYTKIRPIPKGNLLIKGSRGMKLERVLDILDEIAE